jgi:hypothetical protein
MMENDLWCNYSDLLIFIKYEIPNHRITIRQSNLQVS